MYVGVYPTPPPVSEGASLVWINNYRGQSPRQKWHLVVGSGTTGALPPLWTDRQTEHMTFPHSTG